jgi:ribosomal protein S18 acetylase RimI-like enzyme
MDPCPAPLAVSTTQPLPGEAPAANILVREASLEDAGLIAHLTRISWAHKVAYRSSGHHEDVARVEHDLRTGGGFVLQVDGQVAGSVRWRHHDYEPAVWHIVRMGVLPDFRGAGLSQYLLEAVIHHALAADIDQLRLTVHTDQSRLIDLYAAFGFELAPELDAERSEPLASSSIVMRKSLGR